jgi:regulator of protease activity HflC (stomatin/prohibitin superfamily)
MNAYTSERICKPISGYAIVLFMFVFALICVAVSISTATVGWLEAGGFVLVVLGKGLVVINPNAASILLLFGAYRGSIRESGLFWVNPFYKRINVSLRARNFESEKEKVNDKLGNPVMISVILVWKVKETYKASFAVDDYANFIRIQTDSAVRKLAATYAYDHFEDEKATITLSTDFDEVNNTLEREIDERLGIAGIEVVEARITHLAYAPEIAHSMLKRQQASAVVAARHKIVEGAVGMVESALNLLSSKKIIDLDEDKKAAMVSNLMVVLCGDRESQPVVNTGTLNH